MAASSEKHPAAIYCRSEQMIALPCNVITCLPLYMILFKLIVPKILIYYTCLTYKDIPYVYLLTPVILDTVEAALRARYSHRDKARATVSRYDLHLYLRSSEESSLRLSMHSPNHSMPIVLGNCLHRAHLRETLYSYFTDKVSVDASLCTTKPVNQTKVPDFLFRK